MTFVHLPVCFFMLERFSLFLKLNIIPTFTAFVSHLFLFELRLFVFINRFKNTLLIFQVFIY